MLQDRKLIDYEDDDEIDILEEDDDEEDLVLSQSDEDDANTYHQTKSSRRQSDDDELNDGDIKKHLYKPGDEEDEVLFSLAQQRARNVALEKEYLASSVKHFQSVYQDKLNELEVYENAITEAVETADGVKTTAAIRLRDEAKAELAKMDAQWAQADEAYTQNLRQIPQKVQELAGKFCEKHNWANLPESMRKKWLKVDSKIVAAGFDPASPEYYKKLENSLKGLGLLKTNTQKNTSSVAAPRRTNNAPKEIKLSRQRVEAIEAMGYEKGSAEFIRMAKAYDRYDKQGGADASRARLWSVGG